MSSGGEEDDYMSEKVLSEVVDVKPGISSDRNHLRMKKISANRDRAEKVVREPNKAELEKIRLDEGLNRPICSQSKGFSLLAKMGYKPGMSLGKKREGESEGIKEPVGFLFKANKTGLGHDTDEREKQDERCNLHLETMAQQAKISEILADDFRSRKRHAALQNVKLGDMRKARKACQELDIRSGKELPECGWFWPIYREDDLKVCEQNPSTSDSPDSKRRRLEQSFNRVAEVVRPANAEEKFFYSNRKEAHADVKFSELSQDDLESSLMHIVNYLRETHFYCIWCGCAYESKEDIEKNCPGKTREEHDE